MAGQLTHRGPDDEGYWVDGSIGFGHRRLSIIDLQASHQPMASPDGQSHITFNGEILNFADLRARCPYPYRTEGDTEVLLALHARHGRDAVELLDGQFAYAFHDGRDLWLHRDRLGILPLFYYVDASVFAFASEIKALLPAVPGGARVDLASLDSYLGRRSVAAPFTLFEGVRKLLPGHRLRVEPTGRAVSEPYWTVPDVEAPRISDREAIDAVEEELSRAVGRALVADVPVGSLLSGGVDSSLIVALATKLRDGEPVNTFSAGFGDERHDELPQAREVSDIFGTRHHEVVLDPVDFEAQWRMLTWHRDAPLSEPADVAVFALASKAADHVKVLLSGEGSDEIFAGYPKYRMARPSRAVDLIPSRLRGAAFGWAEHALPIGASRGRVALRALAAESEAERIATWFAPFTAGERAHLLADAGFDPVSGGRVLPEERLRPDGLRGGDPVRRMLLHDCNGWLADNLLERGDRMAMAASVELRPPFLDHHLVELAFSLPTDMLVRGRQTKWVLKEVARRHLPDHLVDRRKVGFRVPLDRWFRGHLRDLTRDRLLSPDSFVGQTLDRVAVADLVDAHESGRRDESIRIWTLLSLETWHDVFFAPAAGSSAGNAIVREVPA